MDEVKNQRMCIVCRQRHDKNELIRIVRFEGKYSIDRTGKKNGRGAYVCDKTECVTAALKKQLLNRTFKEAVPAEVYEALLKEYESKAD